MVKENSIKENGKLIVLVELQEESLKFLAELLQELEYDGETRCFADLESAVTFLESIKGGNGELDCADLILCGYNVEQSDGPKIFEMLKRCSSMVRDAKNLNERVLICSDQNNEIFRSYVQKQESLGFLSLPFVKEEVIKCLTENKLVTSSETL